MRPFATPPPSTGESCVVLSFPAEYVMHVALNRPDKFNALRSIESFTLDAIWDWYEKEPSLRCAIMGTTSRKAWCAGGDLKELVSARSSEALLSQLIWPRPGTRGSSRYMERGKCRIRSM